MEIHCRLNVILAERGIKKGWFAKEVGINAGTLSGWCQNKTLPEIDQAYRAAVKLDLNVMEIWVIKQTEPAPEK